MNLFLPDGQPQTLVDDEGSQVWLQSGWLDPNTADAVLRGLEAEVRVEAANIRLFGREVSIPRLQAWHGDPGASYRYSGVRLEPIPWTATLSRLLQPLEVERLRLLRAKGASPADSLGFNSVLVNLYRDGRDAVGWHADDEPELGPTPTIASLSLGATRRFRLKERSGPREWGIELHHGDLLWMVGRTQTTHLHCVPRTTKAVGPRWNLTFRRVRRGPV